MKNNQSTVGRCESLLVEVFEPQKIFDLPAQDDARLGPSGFLQKLFHPERDSFYPLQSPGNAQAMAWATSNGTLAVSRISGQRVATPRPGKTELNEFWRVGKEKAPNQMPSATSGNLGYAGSIPAAPEFIQFGESSSIRPRKQALSYLRATRRVMPDRRGLTPRLQETDDLLVKPCLYRQGRRCLHQETVFPEYSCQQLYNLLPP